VVVMGSKRKTVDPRKVSCPCCGERSTPAQLEAHGGPVRIEQVDGGWWVASLSRVAGAYAQGRSKAAARAALWVACGEIAKQGYPTPRGRLRFPTACLHCAATEERTLRIELPWQVADAVLPIVDAACDAALDKVPSGTMVDVDEVKIIADLIIAAAKRATAKSRGATSRRKRARRP
jgi:hypothetical protein